MLTIPRSIASHSYHANIFKHMYMYMYTYKHVYMYIHTYICTCTCTCDLIRQLQFIIITITCISLYTQKRELWPTRLNKYRDLPALESNVTYWPQLIPHSMIPDNWIIMAHALHVHVHAIIHVWLTGHSLWQRICNWGEPKWAPHKSYTRENRRTNAHVCICVSAYVVIHCPRVHHASALCNW